MNTWLKRLLRVKQQLSLKLFKIEQKGKKGLARMPVTIFKEHNGKIKEL